MSEYKSHYSVLNKECIDFLTQNTDLNGVYADMTFGAGGHTFALASKANTFKVFSVDQDPDAIKNGLEQIEKKGFSNKVELLKMNFESFAFWAKEKQLYLDGIIMDLGVSSHHFDDFSRGFSFREDASLDMRMSYDNDDIATAADLLNDLDEESIANLIFKYGEERLSRRIAARIVEARQQKPITMTKQLEDICFHAYPKNQRFGKIHPATRTFQALRIAVNKELEVLENSIEDLVNRLKPLGRLAIISFHSLEDRIVKHKFKEISQSAPGTVKILTKRPLTPSDKELEENPRSRSAKLRVIEKL